MTTHTILVPPVLFTRSCSQAKVPERKHEGDAGFDLYCSKVAVIPAHGFADVPCDINIALPPGIFARITGRSSTMRKHGLLVIEGIIDQGYRGPLFAGVYNLTEFPHVVEPGERLAQLILQPICVPEKWLELSALPTSDRGANGFGSTGR